VECSAAPGVLSCYYRCRDFSHRCSGGTTLTNGTICQSCGGVDAQNRTECEQGCDFGDKSKGAPSVWKALLPVKAQAGGSYTIEITSSDSKTPIVLHRVTYGDVFFCSGQSNVSKSCVPPATLPSCMHAQDTFLFLLGNCGGY
jgi:hypothetical protein